MGAPVCLPFCFISRKVAQNMNITFRTLFRDNIVFAFADDEDRMVGSAKLCYEKFNGHPIAVIKDVHIQDGYIPWTDLEGRPLDQLLVIALTDFNRGRKKADGEVEVGLIDQTGYKPIRQIYEKLRAAPPS